MGILFGIQRKGVLICEAFGHAFFLTGGELASPVLTDCFMEAWIVPVAKKGQDASMTCISRIETMTFTYDAGLTKQSVDVDVTFWHFCPSSVKERKENVVLTWGCISDAFKAPVPAKQATGGKVAKLVNASSNRTHSPWAKECPHLFT